MTSIGKLLTLLIFGAILLAVLTHAAGFSAAAMTSGDVLDNTLSVVSGSGRTGGSTGTVGSGSVTLT